MLRDASISVTRGNVGDALTIQVTAIFNERCVPMDIELWKSLSLAGVGKRNR
jgi:hypothetical protein